MRDITGYYNLFDSVAGGPVEVQITQVSPTGKVSGGLGGAPFQEAQYNDATAQIFFTTQKPTKPPSILVDFYTGGVSFTSKGVPIFMTGVHHNWGKIPNIFHGSLTTWVAIFTGRIIG
jgi:hypothetical protein